MGVGISWGRPIQAMQILRKGLPVNDIAAAVIDGVSFSARADMRSCNTVVSGRRGNVSLSTLVIVEPTPVMRGWPFPSKEELLRHSKECHEVRMRNRQRELDAVRLILRDMGGASR